MDGAELHARVTAAAQSSRPGSEIGVLRRLPGGVSSLTYATELRHGAESEPIVVKVAPVGLEPVKNRDVLRQARVLQALSGQEGIRVPGVLFEDAALPPLFAMDLVVGDSYEPHLDVMNEPPTPHVVEARARAAARMLARMQSLSLTDLGLDDEPVTSIEGELNRWAALFATVDEDICPGHEALHARLAAQVPTPVAPTLLHGDYRLANMLFDAEELTAIIDWEIWSVGDPRTDLAWLLMHTDPAHYFRRARSDRDQAAGAGMPRASELLGEYLAIRPAEVADLDWFLAYCHYKTASTIAVFVKRNRRLADPDPIITVGGESLGAVIARGNEIMDHVEQGRRWML